MNEAATDRGQKIQNPAEKLYKGSHSELQAIFQVMASQ